MCNRNEPPRSRTPVWQAIANAIRAEISEGRHLPGDRLPTEAQLAARFGVNRHTVRHGLSRLVDEGLVHTRRGAGAFVAAVPTDYPLGKRVRFHENLLAAGRRPEKRQLDILRRSASAAEARALAIADGAAVCAYHGLSLADGVAIAVFESVFPLERAAGIDRHLHETGSVTEALARAGVSDFTRASTRLTAVRADATQALHLQLREGDPLLRSTSVNVGADGQPVEFGRTWFAGDRVTLTLEA